MYRGFHGFVYGSEFRRRWLIMPGGWSIVIAHRRPYSIAQNVHIKDILWENITEVLLVTYANCSQQVGI